MKIVKYGLCLLTLFVQAKGPNDNFCGIHNTTTQNGEEISYTVFYSLAGMNVAAGSATFSNKLEYLNGKPVFHVVGMGGSNPRYDWIYKVRDKYESYIDTSTMQPLKFVREVHEGSNKEYERINFNRHENMAVTDSGVYKVPSCIQDVLSATYYARNIDFNKLKKGDKIPFQMFLENKVNNLYIRYLGKEEIKTKYGKFKAIKFSALLIPGTIFKGGEEMTVWVSDDPNRVAVRIESQILIGSVKVDMSGYKNLRYPLSSLEIRK